MSDNQYIPIDRDDHNRIIKAQTNGLSLEMAIYNAGYQKGLAASKPPAVKGAMQWVKASERFPEDWITVVLRQISTGRILVEQDISMAADEVFIMDDTSIIPYDDVEWLDESESPAGSNPLLNNIGENEYYDLSELAAEEKAKVINTIVEACGREIMKAFYSIGLKTHIECTLINDPTGEEFEFVFRKKAAAAGSLPADVIDKILNARDALVKRDIDEAFHQLYAIASPRFDKLEPWKEMEAAAGSGKEEKAFAEWLEENTEIIRDNPKITLYRYCNKMNEWGNYTLDDIYTEYANL